MNEKWLQSGDRSAPPGVHLLHELRGHREPVRRMAWAPDGRRLASPSSDCTIRLWNTETGELLRTLQSSNHITVYCASWSPDGQLIASGGEENSITLWNVDTGEIKRHLVGHDGWVNSLSWSPKDSILASASYDYSIRFWDSLSGEPMHTLIGHRGIVHNIAWAPDGLYLASASSDGTVRIWDASGRLCHIIEHGDYAFSVAWARDGRSIATSSSDSRIRIWDIETCRQLLVLEGHTARLTSLSYSFDGRLLGSKAMDDTVRLWRCDTWSQLASISESSSRRKSPSIAFSPTSCVLASLGKSDTVIRLWRLEYETLLKAHAPKSHYYRNAKVVLLGDTGVGKSGLARVLSNKHFDATESTHGYKISLLLAFEMELPDGHYEKREILLWDFAGQPGYRIVHQMHLHDATVALVVFDARNETDPFRGVDYWARALRQAARITNTVAKKFLVIGRADRGRLSVSRERINDVWHNLGFDGFFETSAKEGWGIAELMNSVQHSIPWEALPLVTSTELFDRVKGFLLGETQAGRLLATSGDLFRSFCHENPDLVAIDRLRATFEICIGLMENEHLIRRLSFGGLVLLQSERLDSYSSMIINAARDEPDGLGFISEQDALNGNFRMPADERLDDVDQEKLLLIATVEELLRHEIAFRETGEFGTDLVFPSQLTRERPDAPDPPGKAVLFSFQGALQNIYATLIVRLSRSRFFAKREMWKNAATFEATVGGICGVYLREV